MQFPYSKKSNADDEAKMDPIEREFHESYKPVWGPGATLLYAIPGKVDISKNQSAQTHPILNDQKGAMVSEGKDIRFAKFTIPPHVSALCLSANNIASTHANKMPSSSQTH